MHDISKFLFLYKIKANFIIEIHVAIKYHMYIYKRLNFYLQVTDSYIFYFEIAFP